jgi:hypothetical protein
LLRSFIGVCNGCRAVLGWIDAQTGKFCRKKGHNIHHELYDFNDVLGYTWKLCPSCHGRYNAEQGIYEWNMKPTEVQEKFEMREKLFT